MPESEITANGNQLCENVQNIVLGNYDKTLLAVVPGRSEGVRTRTRSRNNVVSHSIENPSTRPLRNSLRIEEEDSNDLPRKTRERRLSARVIDYDDESQISEDNYVNMKETRFANTVIPTENLEGRRLTRSVINAAPTQFQDNRVNSARENSVRSSSNSRETPKDNPRENVTNQPEDFSGFSKTRSGRMVVSNNSFRQAPDDWKSRTAEVKDNTRRITQPINDIRPTGQQTNPPANDESNQRRLRARRPESMKMIEYDFDDFEQEDYENFSNLYENPTRKRVKKSPTYNVVDPERNEIAEGMHPNDLFERDIEASQNRNGRETRGSSRLLQKNAIVQEAERPLLNPREPTETNPLEQNLAGVRTRSGFTRGTSAR